MREFLFNEKKNRYKGKTLGGGGWGSKKGKGSVAGNAAFGERTRRVTFASQNWFKNDESKLEIFTISYCLLLINYFVKRNRYVS